ncbi:MAG: nucleotidyl transferase AbiEii/AbiGii toxin family protein [Kiloniellales bacterium]
MKPHLEILPPPQRAFWDEHARSVPEGWVLYGGTAIALRYGHRTAIDFVFFSDRELNEDALRREVQPLRDGTVLTRRSNTLIAAAPVDDGEVRLSFFGTIGFGRVGEPDRMPDKFPIASPLDLLATKLKVLPQRVEARDYIDVDVLLRNGLSLNQGVSAALALFPDQFNPLDIAKAVGWFKEGDLDARLPEGVKDFLTAASVSFRPEVQAMKLAARELGPGTTA